MRLLGLGLVVALGAATVSAEPAKPARKAAVKRKPPTPKADELQLKVLEELGKKPPDVSLLRDPGAPLPDLSLSAAERCSCKCNAPPDIDKRIEDAEAFTAKSFATALAKRKLTLASLPTVALLPTDKVDKANIGDDVTLVRDGKKIRVTIGDVMPEPEIVQDARGMFHYLERAPKEHVELYDRCDGKGGGGGSALIGGGRRIGRVIDKLGAPIKLSYPTRLIVANSCTPCQP